MREKIVRHRAPYESNHERERRIKHDAYVKSVLERLRLELDLETGHVSEGHSVTRRDQYGYPIYNRNGEDVFVR